MLASSYEHEEFDFEPMRELDEFEIANVAFLTENDIPYGLLELTETGLTKSILDATKPFRSFLQEVAVHDFDRQSQGPEFKVSVSASLFVDAESVAESTASLYRPLSKSGDPRVWFRGLPKVASPLEVVAVIFATGRLWVVNISRHEVPKASGRPGPLGNLLATFVRTKSKAVADLLGLLRAISSKGFIPAPVRGSTAVGRLLENELNIEINSRREPDFRGIEIKASRKESNRVTLFAKTPSWVDSPYKSSRAILKEFGYEREGKQTISCSISAIVTNSQGLRLEVDEGSDLLFVTDHRHGPRKVVQWDLEVLRHTLSLKHNETFWVKAESKLLNDWEYIRFTSVIHTKSPLMAQFATLLREGKITVDFLIREKGDKGYLFKIWPRDVPLLFPPSTAYQLATSESVQARVIPDDLTLF